MTSRVFKKYQPGKRASLSVHVDLLVDGSGSMGDPGANKALEMAWGIKRALDEVDASSSIMQFHSHVDYILKPNERAAETKYPAVGSQGWTEIAPGLWQAVKNARESEARFRAVFALTDGQYDQSDVPVALAQLKKDGVYTAIFFYLPRADKETANIVFQHRQRQFASDGWQWSGVATRLPDISHHIQRTLLDDIQKFMKEH